MKKSTLLACAAALVISSGGVGAQSAPTYDDNLILPNPVSAPALGNVVLVPVASPQTVSAVHDYVKAWQNAEINIAKAKVKYENHERMTKAEKKWLHSYDKHNYADYFRTHSIGRVHGQEVFLNWNGENRNKNEYEYFEMPKYNKEDGFTNSYGYNVLRGMTDRINEIIQKQKEVGGPMTDDEAQALEDAILDVMAKDQENVSNEELRHYMNETVWFAAKKTVKNKASEEPTVQDEYTVDLREAINKPLGNAQTYKKVDLRTAIQ